MDHKRTSLVNILIIAVFMVLLAVITIIFGINDDGISGAAVRCSVECYSDSDCDDKVDLTEDICLYAGECSSKCFNVKEK
jgi:hypothetical protein